MHLVIYHEGAFVQWHRQSELTQAGTIFVNTANEKTANGQFKLHTLFKAKCVCDINYTEYYRHCYAEFRKHLIVLRVNSGTCKH